VYRKATLLGRTGSKIHRCTPGPNLIVAFGRQNEIISLWKRASSQLEKHSPSEVSHHTLPFSYWLWLTVCKRQTNAILNKIMDLFHNEIISFCQRKATIRLAAGFIYEIPTLYRYFKGWPIIWKHFLAWQGPQLVVQCELMPWLKYSSFSYREKLREAGGCRVLVSVLESGNTAQQDRVLNSLLQFLYDNHRQSAPSFCAKLKRIVSRKFAMLLLVPLES
jgi:hypothetical protein